MTINLQPSATFDIAIVGRGLVGMTAARALAEAGHRVALIGPSIAPSVSHSSNTPSFDLRVYALSALTKSLLTDLKVWPALQLERVAAVSAMRVFSPAPSRTELLFDAANADAANADLNNLGALSWIVEHKNLHRALEQALTFSNVTMFDAKLDQINRDARSIQLSLSSGQTIAAKLLVGADGVESTVRRLAHIDCEHRDYPARAIVANIITEKPHDGIAYQWFGSHGVVALLPLPPDSRSNQNRVSLVWSGEGEIEALSTVEIASRLQKICGDKLGGLSIDGEVKSFGLAWMQVSQPTLANIVLIGDAAHSIHPLAGQGMNLGFGDIQALCTVLSNRLPGQNIGDARLLRQYQRLRAEPVAAMLWVTDQLQSVFGSPQRTWQERALQRIAQLGWWQLARPNALARQTRKRLIAQALA